MNCINTKTKEFQELLEASKLPSLLLEMRISKFQEKNGLESFPKLEDIIRSNKVIQTLKSVDILSSDKAKQVFEKGKKNNWSLDKIMTELQIPKDQKALIIEEYNNLIFSNNEITIEPTLNELVLQLASKYSYTVEINTAKSDLKPIVKEVLKENKIKILHIILI